MSVLKDNIGRPTLDELDMIRDYIIYPHLITMVQKSMDDMNLSRISLKSVVMRCLEVIMFKISDDYHALKKELKQRNIKVVEEDTKDGILYFRYFCRGYEERFGIVRETLKTHISLKITEYTKGIEESLRSDKM